MNQRFLISHTEPGRLVAALVSFRAPQFADGVARCYLMESMDIRPAVTEDVPGVLPMVAKICALHEGWDPAKYGFLANPHERYRCWLAARAGDPRSVFLVAEREGRLIGFLIGTIDEEIPIYRLKEFGFIHDVWVEEEYRHEGIARQMVMLAIEQFKSQGVRQIRLDTAMANEAARKLFASCGFRISTMEMLMEL